MKKILIAYWSSTGNTEEMASLIKNGAESNDIIAEMKNISDILPEEIDAYDVLALGCPAMGDEELESEMEDFLATIESELEGRSIVLFGSYSWGDGQWMVDWAERMKEYGASLICEPLIVHEKPEGEEAARCVLFGKDMFSARYTANR